MNEPMSPTTFKWMLTILTGGLAGTWIIYDLINLIRTRTLDRSDPVVRDKHFGYVMGIVIGAVGIVGCLLYWNIL